MRGTGLSLDRRDIHAVGTTDTPQCVIQTDFLCDHEEPDFLPAPDVRAVIVVPDRRNMIAERGSSVVVGGGAVFLSDGFPPHVSSLPPHPPTFFGPSQRQCLPPL